MAKQVNLQRGWCFSVFMHYRLRMALLKDPTEWYINDWLKLKSASV